MSNEYLTLIEAAKLTQNPLKKGVIETFARTSPVLERLPFFTVAGNSYSYLEPRGTCREYEGADASGAFGRVGCCKENDVRGLVREANIAFSSIYDVSVTDLLCPALYASAI